MIEFFQSLTLDDWFFSFGLLMCHTNMTTVKETYTDGDLWHSACTNSYIDMKQFVL